ncbi:type I-E CRISPR-associated protein Cse2/CasB [Streptomyces sp. NBC_00287]|uniref:type I-E CRISPR-associated protein Cse2/CasB n=1 Tax=Streptomyces sp. NBC_00287 TaxID=2975702 RepID=UPI002E2D5D97|nr:type I-E CRISPR-associated protein Cse2/CasB [Streptomyces sp. NBC_00287]
MPAAVAAVARLRREAGRTSLADPASWGLDDAEELTRVREKRLIEKQLEQEGQAADPSFFSSAARRRREQADEQEEIAVHIAVTLWALHQQSLRDEPMHRPGWPLGRAVRRLAHGMTGVHDPSTPPENSAAGDRDAAPANQAVEEASETIRKRFVRIGTASHIDLLAVRLREMVLLLRGARIPLDYGLLADQLLRWQDQTRRADVCRAWGREFHAVYRSRTADMDKVGTVSPSAEDHVEADAGD